MNLETSLNAYRASSSPSIAISDAQAEGVLTWAENLVNEDLNCKARDDMASYSAGFDKALAVVLERLPETKRIKKRYGIVEEEGQEAEMGFNEAVEEITLAIEALQSSTEKKCEDQPCRGCKLNETCKEHEEHHD